VEFDETNGEHLHLKSRRERKWNIKILKKWY
jgi:hypothetical protein